MVILLILMQQMLTTDSFKIKDKITDQTGNDGTENVEITVPLKYVSIFNSWNVFN